jgi:hypothetical protein
MNSWDQDNDVNVRVDKARTSISETPTVTFDQKMNLLHNTPNLTPAAIQALALGQMDNFVAASTPGGIEAQEAAGQAKLCAEAARLPINIMYQGKDPWEQVERFWGIKHGEVVDKIFYSVTLPEGWSIKPTDHAMWNDLVDAAGHVRGNIFFKAAFYDYNSHMFIASRYSTDYAAPEQRAASSRDEVHQYHVVDRLTGEKIYSTALGTFGDVSDDAHKWLKEHFPLESGFAYWPDCEGK